MLGSVVVLSRRKLGHARTNSTHLLVSCTLFVFYPGPPLSIMAESGGYSSEGDESYGIDRKRESSHHRQCCLPPLFGLTKQAEESACQPDNGCPQPASRCAAQTATSRRHALLSAPGRGCSIRNCCFAGVTPTPTIDRTNQPVNPSLPLQETPLGPTWLPPVARSPNSPSPPSTRPCPASPRLAPTVMTTRTQTSWTNSRPPDPVGLTTRPHRLIG